MGNFVVVLKDGSVDRIADADTYEQEGPLTTFFRTSPDRQVIDCWSVRQASLRTADICSIRRFDEGDRLQALNRVVAAQG